jgi:hypothetical protein
MWHAAKLHTSIAVAAAISRAAVLSTAAALSPAVSAAAEPAGAAPAYGTFPDATAGVSLLGELLSVDPINRRGLLRPGGDLAPDRYNRFLGQPFALLPYGMVYYHGAPAELKDVPLGTVLHGLFYLPPAGDDSVPRPNPKDKIDAQRLKYLVPQTHALLLEDDVSFYRRHGQAWRITGIETSEDDGRKFLVVTSVGREAPGGLSGEQKFSVDAATRVWKGREFAGLADVQSGQTVQVNLTWDPNWGYGKFHVLDLWLDQKAVESAAEIQRQTHIRYQRYHWLPGWIEEVAYDSTKPNGAGTVTVTLFGGLDPSLYDEVVGGRNAQVAVAEPTLRTWRKDQDSQGGRVVDVKKITDPPLGSSGIRLQIEVHNMLEGFRAGSIVRVGTTNFPAGVLPPEERVNGPDDRTRSLSGGTAPSR